MIGQRFRSLGLVAGVATAATCLYMVSLQVAAERGKLEAVEHQIATAQRDMRQLQTELGTRASLRQLEKWNGDVLALSAPKAAQFLHGERQLASLGLDAVRDDMPNAPPAVMNASFSPAAAVPVITPVVVPVKTAKAPVESANVRAGFQRAIYEKPEQLTGTGRGVASPRRAPVIQPARVQRVAMLDARIVRDINQTAAEERRKRP